MLNGKTFGLVESQGLDEGACTYSRGHQFCCHHWSYLAERNQGSRCNAASCRNVAGGRGSRSRLDALEPEPGSRSRDPCWQNGDIKSWSEISMSFQCEWDNYRYGDRSRRPMRMITSLRGLTRIKMRCQYEKSHEDGVVESSAMATVGVAQKIAQDKN